MNRHVKNSLIAFLALACAFAISLLFQYIFDVREHITTLYVFAVFLVSLSTDGYFYGVLTAIVSTIVVNYAFTLPYYALNFTTPAALISTGIMIAIAILTGGDGSLRVNTAQSLHVFCQNSIKLLLAVMVPQFLQETLQDRLAARLAVPQIHHTVEDLALTITSPFAIMSLAATS